MGSVCTQILEDQGEVIFNQDYKKKRTQAPEKPMKAKYRKSSRSHTFHEETAEI